MSTTFPTWEHERAVLARRTREVGPDHPTVADARRDFRAARLAAYIEKVVAQAPPLTSAQRDGLALLLRGGDAA
jgi:hypothetical protein